MAKVSVGVLNLFNHEVQEWALYKGRLEQWFLANEISDDVDKSGVKRRAILLSSLSEATYRLIRDLALPGDVGALSYSEVTVLLDGHFTSRKCSFAERHRFHSAGQELGESLAQWAARVRGLAMHCGFPAGSLDETLRDRFVLGMIGGPERDRLFTESLEELTLVKAVQLAETVRCAREGARQSVAMGAAAGAQIVDVNKMAASSGSSTSQQPRSSSSRQNSEQCSVCGYNGHIDKVCRFKNYVCRKCNEKGHLKRVCKKSEVNHHFLQCCSEGDDALVHDLAECIVGDITPHCGVTPEDKHRMEDEAMQKIAELTGMAGDRMYNLYKEYENQSSPEAKFAKDLDMYDMILQAFEYEKRENTPKKLQEFFTATEGKFNHPFIQGLVKELNKQREEFEKKTPVNGKV